MEARPRSGRRPVVTEAELTGDAEIDELTEWQDVGCILIISMARAYYLAGLAAVHF